MRYTIFILTLLLAGSLWAQPKDNSPFSRLGLGDLSFQNPLATSGMGRITAAFSDVYQLNFENPASHGFLRSTGFEAGLFINRARLTDENSDDQPVVWSGNLDNLSLAFPLINPLNEALDRKRSPFNWGMGFSLRPFSTVGYNINVTQFVEGPGDVQNAFQGEGGTYILQWGNGWKYKNLSVGLGIGYFFGNNSYSSQTFFNDLSNSYFNVVQSNYSVRGWQFKFGALYRHYLKTINDEGLKVNSSKYFSFGLYGNAQNGFNTLFDRDFRKLNTQYISDVNSGVDTVSIQSDVEGKGTMPAKIGMGIMYVDGQNLKIGVDYTYEGWGNYTNDAERGIFNSEQQEQLLYDGFQIGGGIEFTPDPTAFKRYERRIRYRLGAFYRKDPRRFEGEQLQQFAITIGTGLPIILRNDISFINLGFEFGTFGVPDKLTENYFNISLGFTLNDNTWFFKRKFN